MEANSKISETILLTAKSRGGNKSTCPSEIARMLFPNDWREHMKEIVDVAVFLQNQGKMRTTQKGLPIDLDHYKGPVRIKII